VNLHTWRVKTLAQPDTLESHYRNIVESLDIAIATIENLMEDPIFVDNIHGEQELSLDLTLELLDTIMHQFEPDEAPEGDDYPVIDDSYDAE